MVLVEHELPSSLQLDLSHPVWVRRITVLIGSPLCQADLARARWDIPVIVVHIAVARYSFKLQYWGLLL